MEQDESDEFSEFLITRRSENVKSYSNTSKKVIKKEPEPEETSNKNIEVKVVEPLKGALTTKKAVELLLEGALKSKVCRYCLNISAPLYELDQVFQIGGQGSLYKVTVRDMIASFYPYKEVEDPNFPNRLCVKCLDSTISAYLFTQQCERSGRALRNCFEDIYEKLDKLDPVNPLTKKRGRQKLNPNHNILYSEHEKVINYADPIIHLINSGIELTEKDKNEINELECPKCAQILPDIESLINHEKKHPKNMWFNCRLCGKSYPKRHLYRKHMKTEHDKLSEQLIVKNTDFQCTNCGVISEVYDKHLQHIEKHKFQMIMEHLVERRMDKLCVVCMGKGIKMVDLNKMISLHGGCPELTGQRSLYNILGSTMPEQNSYKYQEMLIPYKANILEIIKKKNISTLLKTKETAPHNTKNFTLSDPITISEHFINCNEFIYLFTKPITVDEIPTAKEITNVDILLEERVVENYFTKKNVNYEIQEITISDNELKNITQDKPCIENEQHMYTFTKPETNVDVLTFVKLESKETFVSNTINFKEKVTDKAKIVQSCKVCWIFKKPSCETCVRRSSDVEFRISDDINMQENSLPKTKEDKISSALNTNCKYCWIFKNTEKCNYCKKECNIYPHVRSENTGIVKEDIVMKKRKITPNLDSQPKRIKWKCNVCLTENSNSEQCVCCDSKNYNDSDQVKILFGSNKHFLHTDNYNNVEVGMIKSEMQFKGNSVVLGEEVISTTNVIGKDDANMKLIMQDHNLNEAYKTGITMPLVKIIENDDIITMDTETSDVIHNSDAAVVKCIAQEEMDIEENLTSEAAFNFPTTKPTLDFTTTAESNLNFITTAESALNFVATTESTLNVVTTAESTLDFGTNLQYTRNFGDVKPNIQSIFFNFNIGMAPKDENNKSGRRIKKPLRRLASTFHK